MNIASFDDLLLAARQQPTAQRLLLVFAGASLPPDATPEQRAAFDAGQGGELAPLMCVDKTPDELDGFATLVSEAEQFGQPWVIVFAAALSGSATQAPSSDDAQAPLQRMVESVKAGQIGAFIPFDRSGRAVRLA